ncbi:hypothetical protein [Streptomyces sp. NPDC016675]|uniref:hypothetical protein n=1 Tax=Streptomyces sp. NPDC016675 TaxID=3364970 RepID=UPI0036F77A83
MHSPPETTATPILDRLITWERAVTAAVTPMVEPRHPMVSGRGVAGQQGISTQVRLPWRTGGAPCVGGPRLSQGVGASKTLSQEGGPMSREADRLAKAIVVRILSEN